jgi:cyclase
MKSEYKLLSPLLLLLIVCVGVAFAQDKQPGIEVTNIAENIYQLSLYNGIPVNAYALVGPDGVLLVDAGFSATTELVRSELKKISNKGIRYIINTHSDGDHTGGNAALGQGAMIIAHASCRREMQAFGIAPVNALPVLTFQDSTTLYFGSEEIALKHFPGHTGGDILVHFRKAGIAFLGDLVFVGTFPLVHQSGNIYMLEKTLATLADALPATTRIFVGHGRELKRSDLAIYADMTVKTKELVLNAIKAGDLPEDVKKHDVLKEWRPWSSTVPSFPTVESWIDNLYSSLDEGKERSASYALRTLYDRSGRNAAVAKFHEMQTSGAKRYYYAEADFNTWGYMLMGGNDLEMAIAVFKMNVERFPDSWNAYDSLGEAYANAGNKELAVVNYEKSLKLNPSNSGAVEQLKKLKSK